jgi:hypothetical protein
MGMLQRNRLLKPITQYWLFSASLLIAAYMLVDGFAFLLNPYSGRVSTFACKTNSQDRTLCTVTIYGLRDVYRRSFTAEEFYQAVVIAQYTGDSWDTTYGISILTTDESINYIYRIYPGGNLESKARRTNDLFVDGEPVPQTLIVNFGLDPSFYRRIFLVILAFGLAWNSRRTGRYWLEFDQYYLDQRREFWPFMLSWAGRNYLVKLGFYLATGLIFGFGFFKYANYMGDFVSACWGVFSRDPQLSQFPWGHILCLYPLIAILTMQALLQKQLLARVNIRISSWWIAAPLLSSFVVPIFSPRLISDDCQLLKYLMSGLIESYDAPISTALVVFL